MSCVISALARPLTGTLCTVVTVRFFRLRSDHPSHRVVFDAEASRRCPTPPYIPHQIRTDLSARYIVDLPDRLPIPNHREEPEPYGINRVRHSSKPKFGVNCAKTGYFSFPAAICRSKESSLTSPKRLGLTDSNSVSLFFFVFSR